MKYKSIWMLPALTLAFAGGPIFDAKATASPVAKIVQVVDTSGNPVSGATLTISGTALTAGAYVNVSGTNIDTNAPLSSAPLKYYDFTDGTGQYTVIYDPASAQAHFVVTASKSGVTISNPTFGLNFYSDPSTLLSTNGRVIAALPTAAPGSLGGLIPIGTGAGALNPNGSGSLPASPGITTALTGTATAGTTTSITLAAGPAVNNQIKGDSIAITGGTGVGQCRTITGWTGGTLTATVAWAWTTPPDTTSTYAVIMNPHPAVDSNLAIAANGVNGNVTGNVGGVTSGVTLVAGQSTVASNFVAAPTIAQITGLFPVDYLTTAEQTKLLWASTALQPGGAVTLGTADETNLTAAASQTTSIAQQNADIAALSAQGYTITRSGYLDSLPTMQTDFATLLRRIPQVVLFDSIGYIKANAYALPATVPPGYGGSGGGAVGTH